MPTVFKGFEQADLPTSNTTLYTAPASTTVNITSAVFANKHATQQVKVTIEVVRSGGTPVTKLLNAFPVPINASLELIDAKPIVLETGDLIRALADTATSMDVTGSVLEQS